MGMVGHLRDVFVVAPASFHSQQQHHHHNHEQFLSEQAAALHSNANAHAHAHAPHNNAATALGVGVIPLLTTAPCLAEDLDAAPTRRIGGVHLWQNPMQAHPNYMKKPVNDASGSDANADILNVNNSGSGIGIGTTTCQDCGNQAKKDCSHRRCRTCCKSRGFDCSTHVKSTWVPAARRRERQLSAATVAAAAVGSTASTSAVKKPRLISSQTLTSASHTSTSNTTPPRSFDTSSSHQDASFRENLPGHVRAPAVFKCVRVTAVDNGEDEYAYQAVVKIGGHIFKGFLYDQGVEGRDGLPNISDLHLGGPGGGRNEASSSLFPVLDPSDVYAAASGGGMLGGTAYGNPIN